MTNEKITFNPETHNICVMCGRLYCYRYLMGLYHYKGVCSLECKWKKQKYMGFFGLGYEIKITARKMRRKRYVKAFWKLVRPFNLRKVDPILGIIFNNIKQYEIVEIMKIYYELPTLDSNIYKR